MARIQIGDQLYLEEGGTTFGAVKGIRPRALQIYVENAGEFDVLPDAVQAAHDGKVVLDAGRLSAELKRAIQRAHREESPGL
jgi:hypothetical protein